MQSSTVPQLAHGQALVEEISNKVFHREPEAIQAEVSELDAALAYIDTQICGEAHNTFFSCDCECCLSYWHEAFSLCHKCRQFEIIRDIIHEQGRGAEPPAVILTEEELSRRFPEKFRPVAKVAAKTEAKGSHFNFTF